MKIVFHIHNLNKGGAERVVVTLAERFSLDGNEVVIITEEHNKDEYSLSDKVRRISFDREEGSSGLLSRMKELKSRRDELRKALKSEKPDIVIAFARSASYRAVSAANGICPVIVSVRNDPKRDYVGTMNKLFIKMYLNKADYCVFQTEEARSFFDEKLQRKSSVIFNPINEKYCHIPMADKRRKNIVTVGRIAKQKNQLLLLRAFEKLQKTFNDYQLLIYGKDSSDGTLEELSNFIREKKMENAVRFMGTTDSLEKEIFDASLFVLPSDYEGMPNSLMEAMALGIPCISTDCHCGGPASLIQSGQNGILIPVGDAERLAEEMKRLLSDAEEARRLGENGRVIGKTANTETIFAEWKKVVEKII